MPIQTKCPGCGKLYNLKDELAGKKIRCPNCQGVIVVGVGAPPPVRAADVARPPQQRATKARPPVDNDPNATAYRDSPQPRQENIPASEVKKSSAPTTTCPSCGKAMKIKQVTCSACGFNVKLNRRLSITDAIRKTDIADGIRHDGSTYVTRKDKAKARLAQGRKLQIGMFAAVGVLLLLGIAFVQYMRHQIYWGEPLAELRLRVLPRLYAPEHPSYKPDRPLTGAGMFHPWTVGMTVKLAIPLGEVDFEDCAGLVEKKSDAARAGTVFAETCRLPYAKTSGKVASPRVDEAIEKLGGSFAPAALVPYAKVPGDRLPIWRLAKTPEAVGFLSGAVLDFGDGAAGIQARVEAAVQAGKRTLDLTGRLSFVCSDLNLMSPDKYTYAQALRLNLGTGDAKVDRLVPKPETAAAAEGKDETVRQFSELEARYYHPVIIVDSFTFE